ncbi:hypothetical protein [Neobacillus niacini]|uniref:hypothetical protein n=1 Tax=Neobacillus niacini TaxID=86668 RepID=UPI00398388DA
MKKKILFISRDFWPKSNGTISCLENFLPYLGEKYDVILYSAKNSLNTSSTEEYNNITIKRPMSFWDNFILMKLYILGKLERLGLNKLIKKILIIIVKIIFLFPLSIAKRSGIIYGWEKNLIKYLRKHEDLESFDIIIAVGAPFLNIRSAYNIKLENQHLNFIMIQFDLYTDNPIALIEDTKFNLRNSRLDEEQRWYEIADIVLVTNEMNNTIMNSELKAWDSKTFAINMPNLSDILNHNSNYIFNNDNDDINIVYTGTLYEDIRNPTFSLEIFNLITRKDPRIKIHILGSGCEEIIKEYKIKMGENLIFYGHQSKGFSIDAIYSSDFMLNISNRTTSQAPSKILEYIGSCKPIINIYNVKDDICKIMLGNYPLNLSIKEDYSKLNKLSNEVYEFILNSMGKKCSFNDVKQNYKEYLPETFTNKIIKLIEKQQ